MRKTTILITCFLILALSMGMFNSVMALPPGHPEEFIANGVGVIKLENGTLHQINGTLTVNMNFTHKGYSGGMAELKSATGDERIIWQFNTTTDVSCVETQMGVVTYISAIEVLCSYHEVDVLGNVTIRYIHSTNTIVVQGNSVNFVGRVTEYDIPFDITGLPAEHPELFIGVGVGIIKLENGTLRQFMGILLVYMNFDHHGYSGGMAELLTLNDDQRIIWQFNTTTDIVCSNSPLGSVTRINATEVLCSYHAPDGGGSATIQYTHRSSMLLAYGDSVNYVGRVLAYA